VRAIHPRRAMGPVTTAGALAQCYAEATFCVALAQLERPGSPAILGNFLSSMSLRSGAPTFGTPEPALAYFAIGQLARRLGVPLRCGGNLCASKVADSQAASESANSIWPAFLGGANFMLHAAGWLEAGLVMSYEKFVMDVDQLGGFHTLARGMPLTTMASRSGHSGRSAQAIITLARRTRWRITSGRSMISSSPTITLTSNGVRRGVAIS